MLQAGINIRNSKFSISNTLSAGKVREECKTTTHVLWVLKHLAEEA
jgi:hypothetical protein